MLGEYATEKYTQTYSHVPRHEDGAVGCAALVVLGEVDKHILVGGVHVTVA